MNTAIDILTLASDAFMSARLERMLSSMTNSYKIYWLKAYIDEVLDGAGEITFRRMTARMVADAWYPVNYFHLSLGLQDQLGRAVACCKRELGLGDAVAADDIVAAVASSENSEVRKSVDMLCTYVPYRLIRLFYEDELASVREREGKLLDRMVNPAVIECNRTDSNGAPYVFSQSGDSIVVDEEWAAYLRENRCIIEGWLDMRLVEYLQARNPSVPAIPMKVHPPQVRDLSAATKYWKEALSLIPMREIYSGVEFGADAFAVRGSLSIDHFIPWSFVLHDEPWNLVPMFRDSNSSKSDKLPSLEDYLEPFASQQFDALMAVRNTGRHKKIIEGYLQIEPDLAMFENSPACRMAFSNDIAKVIRPLHQIALNQGFASWTPSYEYAVMELKR